MRSFDKQKKGFDMSSKALPTAGRIVALLAIAAVSACVSLAPDTGPTNTADDVYSKLGSRDADYANAQSSTVQGIGWYDAGIIAATVAAAAAIAFSHGIAATHIIAGAGIGATALTLGYQPSGRAAQYKALTAGRSQLNCLQRNMAHLQLVGSENQLHNDLAKKVTTLQKDIGDATILVGQSAPARDATPANLAALTKAISDGSAVAATAQIELNAFKEIDATVTGTYKRIDIAVVDALAPTFLSYAGSKGTGGSTGTTATGGANVTSPNQKYDFHVTGNLPALPPPPTLTQIADATKTVQAATSDVTKDAVFSGKLFTNALSVIPTCVSDK